MTENEFLKLFETKGIGKSKNLLRTGNVILCDTTEDNFPLLSLNVVNFAGGTDGRPGLAHFIEHILCNDDDSDENQSEFEKRNRLKYMANTSDFHSCYFYQGNGLYLKDVKNMNFNDYLEQVRTALKYFFKYFIIIKQSIDGTISEADYILLQNKIEKHRKIILSEMETTSDLDFEKTFHMTLEHFLTEDGFKVYDKNKRIIGDKYSVSKYSLSDLQEYFASYYTNNRFNVFLALPFRFNDGYERKEFLDMIKEITNSAYCHETNITEPCTWEEDYKGDNFYKNDRILDTISCSREDMQAVILSYENTLYERTVEANPKYNIIPRYLKNIIAGSIETKLTEDIVDKLREVGLLYYGYNMKGLIESKNKFGNTMLILHTNNHEEIKNLLDNGIIENLKYSIDDLFDTLYKHFIEDLLHNTPLFCHMPQEIHSPRRFTHFIKQEIPDMEYIETNIELPLVKEYIKEVFDEVKISLLNAKPLFVKYEN